MRIAPACRAVLVLSGFWLSAAPCGAQPVITTNLPPGTSIVNVDARTHGAGGFSGDQSFWFQPTPTAPSVTLAPGTYSFRIINPADAAALYPGLTGAQLSSIFTAWTFNSPWGEDYLAFASTALANPTESQLFDGALAPGNPVANTFGTAQAAYDGTIANGYFNKIRPAPPGRAGDASSYLTEYTFAAPTTLLFVIPDNILSDNGGGVSVVVSPVPEPSALLLGAAGMLAGWRLTRRRRHASPPLREGGAS